jgi:hypothetical protein
MGSFLKFLKTSDPQIAKRLEEAGGEKAATAGDQKFREAWQKLARANPKEFVTVQHAFIEKTHYAPEVAKLRSNLQVDVNRRSQALREVIWSTSVQHGPATQRIVENALAGRQAAKLTDEELIKAIYAERSKVDKYFKRSDAKTKAAVQKRFKQEEQAALKLLQSK